MCTRLEHLSMVYASHGGVSYTYAKLQLCGHIMYLCLGALYLVLGCLWYGKPP
jgi:hypothetical protein